MAVVLFKRLFLWGCCVLFSLTAVANTDPRILVLGDSISAGFGIQVSEGWVALLQKKLQHDHPNIQVINASISGETTQGGATRLAQLLTQHRPTLTLIELGGNDALRGMPIPLIRNNLSQMIRQAQQANSQVLLIGVEIPANYGARYRELFTNTYHALAKQFSVPLVMFSLDKVENGQAFMQADGIHPTAAAQPLLMEWVLEKLPKL